VRQQLAELRLGLLRLHKGLIDSERAQFEARSGPMTSGQLLQALLQDPFFAWLRPFSGMIVEMDETLHGEEPVTWEDVRSYSGRVRSLLAPPAGSDEAVRYEAIRQREPQVLAAHVEMLRRLAAADAM
jgi:hypothetical protein